MKYLVLLIVFPFFIFSNENIQAQWLHTNGHPNEGGYCFTKGGISILADTLRRSYWHPTKLKQSEDYKFQGSENKEIQKKLFLNKNKEKLQSSSFIYEPIKVTCNDTIRHSYSYDKNGNRITDLEEIYSNNLWQNSSSYSYTYDYSGHLLTEVYETWSGSSWVNSFRNTIIYDNSGNLISFLKEIWLNNDWVNSWRTLDSYDISGHLLIELGENWVNNSWVNESRTTYTYDISGNKIMFLFERWTDGAWVSNWRNLYTYDNLGYVLTDTYQYWANNTWVNSTKYTYTNNNVGYLLIGICENWINNSWVNDCRTTCTYDNANNLLTELGEYWSADAWINYFRYTYTYNNNNKTSELYEGWNLLLGWINSFRCTYTYDDFNNLLLVIDEVFSFNSREWENGSKILYNYDNYGNCIHGENYSWQSGSWGLWNIGLNIWYNHHSDQLYFNAGLIDVEYIKITGMLDKPINQLSFELKQNYPNPFNPSTSIFYSLPSASNVKLIIFNTLGQNIKTLENEFKLAGEYTINFNASDLPSGIYFYKLEAGQFCQTKKMVLIK